MSNPSCPECGSSMVEVTRNTEYNPYNKTNMTGIIYKCTKCSKHDNRVTITKAGGCYVATCVYGSYDCPEVWTLRRYRDNSLKKSSFGRQFIRVYYTIAPKMIKMLGNKRWFNRLWRFALDKIVCKLQNNGVDCSPYYDR
jgi:hypothetical protein